MPAYNEEKLIFKVIEGMPDYVDKIIVVDDASSDKTAKQVEKYQRKLKNRLVLIRHRVNQGVGGAIVSGYKRALKEKIDVIAVMAGDNQMDPGDLKKIIRPVVLNQVEYTKGNRLFEGQSWQLIPHSRYFGNALLSLLTKIASGYWHIADSQSGYTGISNQALKKIKLDKVYKEYGMPNDLLVKLNIVNCRVRDVPIKPVYNVGEKSKMKVFLVIPKITWLLAKGFVERLIKKYVIADFHPLVFFYALAFFLGLASLILFVRLLYFRLNFGDFPPFNSIALVFTVVTGFQSLFFSMWFDMEHNKGLR